jgi:hypothetical protein
MMSRVSPETCWALYEYGIINVDKLLHFVGFFCMNFTMMHGSTNIKFLNFNRYHLLVHLTKGSITIVILTWLTLSDPTSNLVRQYDFPVPLRCRKTSDTVSVAFVRQLLEPVRHFCSCSTNFSQQIPQAVLFLFLYVFFNCRLITSNLPTSFPPKTNKYAVGRNIGLERVKTNH